MNGGNTAVSIVTTAIGALPSILAIIRASHANANPQAPPLTDADVFAALQQAVEHVIAKGEAWKAAHPSEPDA
jgi:hypothetical protein